MDQTPHITSIFLDIGNVLLNNGWGRESRLLASVEFGIAAADLEDRHHQIVGPYERGDISLNQYLDLVVFHQSRPFTRDEFWQFMIDQSKPRQDMINLIKKLKVMCDLKIVVVNNEGRELNVERIRKFKLDSFVDLFVSSCFVHVNKPSKEIYQIALDLSQVPIEQILYIESAPMLVELARSMGIRSILHSHYKSTCMNLLECMSSTNEAVLGEVG